MLGSLSYKDSMMSFLLKFEEDVTGYERKINDGS
jgi:hypothetical protein